MRNHLFLLLLSLTLSCQAFSQKNISDSVTCLPNTVLRKVQKDIINGKTYKKYYDSLLVVADLLKYKLDRKDSAISIYVQIDSIRARQNAMYDDAIRQLYDQLHEQAQEVVKLKNQEKK